MQYKKQKQKIYKTIANKTVEKNIHYAINTAENKYTHTDRYAQIVCSIHYSADKNRTEQNKTQSNLTFPPTKNKLQIK